jgi:hypothetical protein
VEAVPIEGLLPKQAKRAKRARRGRNADVRAARLDTELRGLGAL